MEFAGQRLRRARERLNLKFRDVELASQQIAERHDNQEFTVLISRLSDIESHGTLPSIYRLYSLCCIYRLDLNEVLGWYGIGTESMAADAGQIPIEKTHGSRKARGDTIGGAQVHSIRLPGYVASFETVFGLPHQRLTIRHDAGPSAEPYVDGTLLAIRRVTQIIGLVRGMDRLLLESPVAARSG